MEYTKIGTTGLEVSQIGIETYRFENHTRRALTAEESKSMLDSAWEQGVNFIETANIFGVPPGRSEEIIGEWLSDRDRNQFIISSKVFAQIGDHPNSGGLSRKHIRDQLEKSLDRLNTDYLDIYYVHRWEEDTSIKNTLRTLDRLVQEGSIHHLAISNVAAWQLMKALRVSERHNLERFEIVQPLYNASYTEAAGRIVDVCADQNLAVAPYLPLASGLLTGQYTRQGEERPPQSQPKWDCGSFDDFNAEWRGHGRGWAVLEEIRAVADELDTTPAQVSLRWLIDHDRFDCVPIIPTTDQMVSQLGAVDLSLSQDQFERINTARNQFNKFHLQSR